MQVFSKKYSSYLQNEFTDSQTVTDTEIPTSVYSERGDK